MTAKGLMNRAHSYKAAVQANIDGGDQDPDKGITMALYSYPILMAADILMFNARARCRSARTRNSMSKWRVISRSGSITTTAIHSCCPKPVIDEHTAVLNGLDGRKMSKSYNNTIPLFADEKALRKLIMKIKTNSLEPGEPKDTADSTLYDIYKAFASAAETRAIEEKYAAGIAWGEMKQALFEHINEHIKPARDEYRRLLADPAIVEAELAKGAARAREIAVPFMQQIRGAIGIRSLA